MIIAAFYSALLLLVTLSEYRNSKRFWQWLDGLHGADKQEPPEEENKTFKAQFGSFYS